MSVSDFIAAAEQADPSLKGEGKAQTEIQQVAGEVEALAKDVAALDKRLTPLTYIAANQPSSADVGLYCHLHPTLLNAPASAHPTHPAITRYFLHIQSLPSVSAAHSALPNSFQPVDIDVASLAVPERVVVDVKKEKKEKKDAKDAAAGVAGAVAEGAAQGGRKAKKAGKEADKAAGGIVAQATEAAGNALEAAKGAVGAAVGAVAAATGLAGEQAPADAATAADAKAAAKKEKKEKKEKAPKPAQVKAEPLAPMPSMIDLRVGKVLDVKKHPEADSLYVESIDVGEPEPRTVCSGLVKYMTEDQIRGATVIVVCNLKPVTMRGVKSFAMLLCASSKEGKEGGGIEFVLPPQGSAAGERVYFEGDKYEKVEPEALLNPKKKVFETIQPGFITLENREAAWIDPETQSVHRIRTKDGACFAPSLVGASLS